MAPKTRGVSGVRAGMKRKRTVSRPTREPTPVSSTSSSSDEAPPPSASGPQVDQFSSRVVTTGRLFNFQLFEREGFLIGAQLKELGFEKICSLNCPTYPALVKEFYRNLCRGDNGLISTVRGVQLSVSPELPDFDIPVPESAPAPAPAFVPMPSAAQPHSSASASTSSSSDLLEQMRLMFRAELVDFEARIDQKLLNLKSELSVLGDRVASVEASISSSGGILSGDLQSIFDKLKDICGDSDVYSKSNAELQGQIQAACTFVNERLTDYVKLQCDGIQNIIQHLTRITRTHF